MNEYPGNSRRPLNQQSSGQQNEAPAEEIRKLEPVVKGKVIRRKKSVGRKLRDVFFGGESSVLTYIGREVLLPALQNLLIDSVTQGVDKTIERTFGVSPRGGRPPFRGSTVSRPHISYDRPSSIVRSPVNTNSSLSQRRPIQPSSRPSNDVGEVILESHMAAQVILDRMWDIVQEYQVVTVSDFKELIGETSHYVDRKWGWDEDAEFSIRRVREGWLLVIPDPVEVR